MYREVRLVLRGKEGNEHNLGVLEQSLPAVLEGSIGAKPSGSN